MTEGPHSTDVEAGWRTPRTTVSLPEVHASIPVPATGFARKFFAFAGPGYLVAVGYMDPGNWATDLAGGARYGYTLLSVIMLSNLMAILLQALAARLGIASGRDLAQACRDAYSPTTTIVLWVLCEIAIAACDLAEVIGAAVALNLLFGLPLIWGVCHHRARRADHPVSAAARLPLRRSARARADRRDRRVVRHRALPCVSRISAASRAASSRPPGFCATRDMLYIAIGILGATVMPHNLYLHSSIVQTRRYGDSVESRKREAIRFASLDSTVALMSALFINSAILIMAAAAFHGTGHEDVADISDAYQLLSPLLGTQAASMLFAVALLLSGQNATLTGTLAGQIVMEGFLNLRLRPWLRRLITRLVAIIPAIIVIVLYGERGAGALLILSQVI